MYIIKILLAPLSNQEKNNLDAICNDMFQNLKSNQKQEICITCFQKSITNLTLLTAAEWVGVAFLLLMFTISA